jgi:hypothetical protein
LLEEHHHQPGRYAIGWYQNVFLSSWWDVATHPELLILQDAHRKFIDSTQGPLFSFAILHHPKPKSATKEERQVLGEIFSYHKERFDTLVFYVKASGLMTVSLQLFLSALKLISKSSTTIKIYNSFQESLESASLHSKVDAKSLAEGMRLLSPE